MTQWLDHPFAVALGSALLHFVWQGAILALLAFAAWRLFPSSPARYLTGVVTLAAMLAAPMVTLGYLVAAGPRAGASERSLPAARIARAGGELPGRTPPAPFEPARAAPLHDGGAFDAEAGRFARPWWSTGGRAWILPLWLAGVLVLSGRLLGGWLVARRLTRRGLVPLAPDIMALGARVAGRLSLGRSVRIVGSSWVSAPIMLGWLRPVVLLPAAVLTALTPAQVEALLAHELAHVRRHDYAVNLLQSIVETLLFYHPAVWWISRQVRTERERCCDDLAVTVCDRVTYVTALADLAALGAGPRVALAATDASLLDRVRRLLGRPHATHPAGGAWLPALLLALAATALLPGVLASPLGEDSVRAGVAGGIPDGVAGGIPDGAAGGVPDGAGGGVPGGVARGLAGGITGGVERGFNTRAAGARAENANGAGGNAPRAGAPGALLRRDAGSQNPRAAAPAGERKPASQAAETGTAREELARLLALEQAVAEQYLRQKSEMDQRRRQLALQTAEAELDAALTQQELEVRDLRRQLERVQTQVKIGLAEPLEQERLENALGLAESRLQAARAEREMRLKQAMLDMEAAQQQLEFEGRQLEIEHARRRLELERGLALGLRAGETEGGAFERTVLADQAQPIVPGDILAIEIAGEPSLPRVYPVADGGTIALPLLGSLPVAGRTADQVGGDIRRLLMERGLKPDPTVVVTRRAARR